MSYCNNLGVRVKKNQKLVGFISGIPVTTHCNDKKWKGTEINFLCVHKKLRSNRLAPLLIKEITRRVNVIDQWQAVRNINMLHKMNIISICFGAIREMKPDVTLERKSKNNF